MSNEKRASRRIDRLLAEYGESHQNYRNKLIHWVCVPVIVWTLNALLWSLPVPASFKLLSPYLNWCTLFLGFSILYYLSLSLTLTVGMALMAVLVVWLNLAYESTYTTPLWQTALVIFVIAWIGQFIGHKFEGKKPSFFKDIQFLLIGPAWLLHFIYKKLGLPY